MQLLHGTKGAVDTGRTWHTGDAGREDNVLRASTVITEFLEAMGHIPTPGMLFDMGFAELLLSTQ